MFFRGEKRANYLNKGKHAWKTQRFKNAKTVDMTRFLYVCIQRRIICSPSHPDVIIGSIKPLKQVFSSVDYNLRKRKGQKKGRLFNWVCFRVFELTLCPSFLLHAYICEL